MFPSGNNVEYCSFYLEHGFPEGEIPDNWYCCAQFGLVLWNPNDPSLYTHHTAHHRFTKEEGDWGFTRFVELRKLFNVQWNSSGRPLVENEAANMTAYVRVVKDETGVLWHTFTNYDSKKETGYVGLKNQGATCYLNSLVQSLFFTNAFRKVRQFPRHAISSADFCRPFTRYPQRTRRTLQTAHIPFSVSFISFRPHQSRSAPTNSQSHSDGRRGISLNSRMCKSCLAS